MEPLASQTSTPERGAKLTHAGLDGADLRGALLQRHDHYGRTDLRYADLNGAIFLRADLREVDATGAVFRDAELGLADFRLANLSEANLRRSHLVETKLEGAILNGAHVYGVSAWDVTISEQTAQKDLVISRLATEPRISVDDIRVAQFVYLLLDNRNIRAVIDTIGRKGVLLLGRFSPERKAVLEALREELRRRGYLPIVFDFERAATKDITDTVMILAGLSLFVIADITNPRSAPLELQATVPDYMTPFVPILERGEPQFTMFQGLKARYDWVLDPLTYDTATSLLEVFEPAILAPALRMHAALVDRKNRPVAIRDVADYRT